MVRNDLRLRVVSKAALYAYFKKRHINQKRWFYAGQSLMMAVVIILSVVLQTYLDVKPPTYKLDEATYGLIGDSRDDTALYLTENKDKKTFSFALPANEDNQAKEHTGRKADAYETTLSTDAKQGITYTDTATKIGITLVPKFRTGEGKKVEGDHIVYPMGAQRLIYTLKYNGLKEDIVIPKYIANDLSYEFELSLPKGVEARLDEAGNIGIYSSDPTLFGEVSYGSDQDRAKLDAARENSEKTSLIVTIPSPIIKDYRGNEYNDRVSFILGEKTQKETLDENGNSNLPAEVREQLKAKSTKNVYSLSLSANNLKDLSYPISLDPTMQSTSAADFSGVVLDEGTEIDTTNNLIKRGSLSGGLVSARQGLTAMSDTLRELALVVSGSTIYKIGGCKRVTINFGGCDTTSTRVDYATITSSGTIGAWTDTGSNLPSGATVMQATIYNGYIYIHGDTHTTPKYARIDNDKSLYKADGTKGWDTGTIPTQSIYGAGFVAVKGYLYILGGVSGTRNYAQYAVLNGDGSIGTWSTTTAINTATQEINATAYNGFIYIVGGYDTDVVQYGKVNDNGTISAWNTTTAFPNRIFAHRIVAFKGYLYSFGGRNETGAVVVNTIHYAQINGDGSVGSWRLSSTGMGSNRIRHSIATDGKFIFSAGGCTDGASSSCNASTDVSTVESYTIAPAGTTQTGTTETNTFTTARAAQGTIVAYGYIYVLGGCTVEMGTCDTNAETLGSTYYAQLSSTGSIGTWTAGTSFPTISGNAQTRGALSATILNDYIYVIGGSGNCGALGVYNDTCNNVFYASINTSTGALSAWTNSANTLPATRRRGTAAAYNGTIYYLGGRDSNSALSGTVYYAGAGFGANGAWSTTNSLVETIELGASTTYGGYIYVGGGYNGTSNPAAIEYAQINAGGDLGTFGTTSSMAEIRDGATLQAYNGYLYIAGGFSGSSFRSSIEYAPINSNGTLGTFATSANALTTAGRRYPGAGGIHNGIMYIAGGGVSGGVSNAVESIPINNGGSGISATGTFTDTDTWTNGRFGHASVVYNGYIYVASGRSIQGCLPVCTRNINDTVQIGTINSTTGNISSWGFTTAVPDSGRSLHEMFAVNGYMFIIGGENNAGTEQNTVYRASISSTDGTLSSWTQLSNFPTTIGGHKGAVVGDTIYITGGEDSAGTVLTTVYYATVDASGTLSSWNTTTALPAARRLHQVVTVADKLYVLGGINTDSTSDIYNTIIVADISGAGTLSAWRNAGILPYKRHSFVAAAANGFLYMGWGCAQVITITTCATEANLIDEVYSASISVGGIGNWQRISTHNVARAQATAHVISGKFYAVAGCYQGCGDDALGDVSNRARYIGGLYSVPRIGSFSRLFDFEAGVKPTKLITRGTKVGASETRFKYLTANNSSSSLDNSGSYPDIDYTGSYLLSFSLGANRTLSQYLWLRYIIDDTNAAIFPDTGQESTITDFDVYYTANPGKRLRGGRTFTNGADRGLGVTP